jgi:hypothetical protein
MPTPAFFWGRLLVGMTAAHLPVCHCEQQLGEQQLALQRQNPLREPRDVIARANSPPAAMARRPADNSG